MPSQDMTMFTSPQARVAWEIAGAVILIVLIFMVLAFVWMRVRKIRHLAAKHPSNVRRYNGFLLFLDYIAYALLVFLGTTLVAGGVLGCAVYLGILLSHNEPPLSSVLIGATIIGVLMGYYVTFKFLRAKVVFEESKLVPVASDFPY